MAVSARVKTWRSLLQLLGGQRFSRAVSQVCRLAYELKQTYYSDAPLRTVSLDEEYFFPGVPFPPRKTLYPNTRASKDEMDWPGAGILIDTPIYASNPLKTDRQTYADGFPRGRIVGTHGDANGSTTIFPKFKTMQTFLYAEFAAMSSGVEEFLERFQEANSSVAN